MINIIEIKQDIDGEFYIEIPENIIDELKWTVNDELEWIDNGDGTLTLKKKEQE